MTLPCTLLAVYCNGEQLRIVAGPVSPEGAVDLYDGSHAPRDATDWAIVGPDGKFLELRQSWSSGFQRDPGLEDTPEDPKPPTGKAPGVLPDWLSRLAWLGVAVISCTTQGLGWGALQEAHGVSSLLTLTAWFSTAIPSTYVLVRKSIDR